MDKKAEVARAQGTLIVKFPLMDISDGGDVLRNPERGFVLFNDFPYLLNVWRFRWFNPAGHRHENYVNEWHHRFVDYDDLEAKATPHLVKLGECKEEAKVGNCLYGLVGYRDFATISDIVKGERLIIPNDVKIKDGNRICFQEGTIKKQHLGYYFSHPVLEIRAYAKFDDIERVFVSQEIPVEEKYDILRRMLHI